MRRTLFVVLIALFATAAWSCLPGPDDSNNGGIDVGGDTDCPPGQERDDFSGECEPEQCRENDDCTIGFFCELGVCVEGPRSCESSLASSDVSGCRGEWLNCDTDLGREDFVFRCDQEGDRWECECYRDNLPEGEPSSFNDQCADIENIHEQANQLCDWAMPKVDSAN